MEQARRIVHDAVEEFGGACSMEMVGALCPELSEVQVVLAIDEMSRSGEIRLMRDTEGTYFVTTCRVATQNAESMSYVP